jgi:hypothetical protein
MNKRSVKSKPAKASRVSALRKTVSRQVPGKTVPRQVAPKTVVAKTVVANPEASAIISVAAVATVAHQLTVRSAALRAHKFRVGQTVLYTSSPISRPGASGNYKVVKLLPSDGDDYQYRIKNPGEAFERVAKESQLEVEH